MRNWVLGERLNFCNGAYGKHSSDKEDFYSEKDYYYYSAFRAFDYYSTPLICISLCLCVCVKNVCINNSNHCFLCQVHRRAVQTENVDRKNYARMSEQTVEE